MIEKKEDLLPLVAELADQYTSKESTSIPYHTARQLMGAVIYCLQEYQQGGIGTDYDLPAGERISIREAYQSGLKMILDKVGRAKSLYHKILPEFSHYGIRACQDTFEKGIPEFFVHYDARFDPQNQILTLDYPVLDALEKSCGIDVIYHYINCMGMEQKFLNRLPASYILHVLTAYHPQYEELFINAAGIVMHNLLGCMLARKAVNHWGYSLKERQCINAVVRDNTVEELEMLLAQKTDEMVLTVVGADQSLSCYLKKDIPNFAFELKTAAEYGCLERILAID